MSHTDLHILEVHLYIICAHLQLRPSHSVAFQGILLSHADLSCISPEPIVPHLSIPGGCRVSGGLCPRGRDMFFREHSKNSYCFFCAEIAVDGEHPATDKVVPLSCWDSDSVQHSCFANGFFFPRQLEVLSLSGAFFHLNPGLPIILTGLRKEPVYKLTKCCLLDT